MLGKTGITWRRSTAQGPDWDAAEVIDASTRSSCSTRRPPTQRSRHAGERPGRQGFCPAWQSAGGSRVPHVLDVGDALPGAQARRRPRRITRASSVPSSAQAVREKRDAAVDASASEVRDAARARSRTGRAGRSRNWRARKSRRASRRCRLRSAWAAACSEPCLAGGVAACSARHRRRRAAWDASARSAPTSRMPKPTSSALQQQCAALEAELADEIAGSRGQIRPGRRSTVESAAHQGAQIRHRR